MKNYFISMLVLLAGCCGEGSAQCTAGCKDCAHNKPAGLSRKELAGDTVPAKAMTCKLTSPELRKRKEEVIAQLKRHVLEKRELPDGYSYRFRASDEMLDTLTAFIKSERLCCDFFNFRLLVGNDSFLWLEISGENGAKEFITSELEL